MIFPLSTSFAMISISEKQIIEKLIDRRREEHPPKEKGLIHFIIISE
ncbi:MAG: hypothetical protein ACLTS6_18845 [Anaerobutyricum sp.]